MARIGIGSDGCQFVFGRTTPIGSSATRPSEVSKRTLTAIVESDSRPPLERAKKRSVGRLRPTQMVLVRAEPPGLIFSEWESDVPPTWKDSLPLCTAALFSDQLVAPFSNEPCGPRTYEELSPQ